MNKTLMYTSISGFLAVALGAFGAHGIKPHIQADQYEVFQTGVMYHFIHTLVLLILALTIAANNPLSSIKWAIRLCFAGIILFSGSLYLLSTRELTGLAISFLGPVTPIGGLCFLASWTLIAWYGISIKKK